MPGTIAIWRGGGHGLRPRFCGCTTFAPSHGLVVQQQLGFEGQQRVSLLERGRHSLDEGLGGRIDGSPVVGNYSANFLEGYDCNGC